MHVHVHMHVLDSVHVHDHMQAHAQVKGRKGEEGHEQKEEERCVSIISSLLTNIKHVGRRDRVCGKFVENEFEKCDHMMELYTRYHARVRAEEVGARLSVCTASCPVFRCGFCNIPFFGRRSQSG